MSGIAPGTVLDRYAVERELGRGGMATVYRVRHVQLGTPYALKVLEMPHPVVQQRLLREGKLQASLKHRNIVSVVDVLMVGAAPALVLEYVDGPSLQRFLSASRPTFVQIDSLARGILDGVCFAHEHGLVHRDLKPANVLLAMDGREVVPKVADFGLAKLLDASGVDLDVLSRSGVPMGTPAYMAPEQIKNAKHVDHRADVFALGVTLYELVSGVRAFEGDDSLELFNKVNRGECRPIRELVPDLDPRIASAIEGAMRPDLDERIPTAKALRIAWTGEEAKRSGPWSVADLQRLGTMRDPTDEQEIPASPMTFTDPSVDPIAATPVQRAARTVATFVQPPEKQSSAMESPSAPPRRVPWGVLASLALVFVVVAVSPVLPALFAAFAPDPPADPVERSPASSETAPAAETPPAPVDSVQPPGPQPGRPRTQDDAPPDAASVGTMEWAAEVAGDRTAAVAEEMEIEAEEEAEAELLAPAVKPDPVRGPTGHVRVEARPSGVVTVDGHQRTENPWNGSMRIGAIPVALRGPDGTMKTDLVNVYAQTEATYCWDFEAAAACD